MVHLDVPSGLGETEVEVMVILQPISEPAAGGREDFAWSPGFFERVVGGWEGEPLARASQGEYEARERL